MEKIYKEIKKSAFKIYILGGLFFLLLGLVLFWGINNKLFRYVFVSAPDLFETPSSQYADGKWFTCDNNILYDYYASDDDGRYYVTSTNDGEYMGFYVRNNKTDIADKISDGTYDYLDGIETELPPIYLSGKGYLKEMSATERRYFEDFFEAGGANLDDYTFTYYNFYMVTPMSLLVNDEGDNNIFYSIVSLIFFICGAVLIINFITGGYKRAIKKSMAQHGVLEDVLERDMAYATRIGNAYIGDKHVLFYAFPGTIVMPYDSLIWAYVMITTTKHTTYGIPSGTTKSYSFTMWDRNHKKNMVSIKDEAIGHQILEEMYCRAPYFFTGYNDDLANATDKGNYSSMISAVDERRNAFLSSQVPTYSQNATDNVLN